MTIHTHCAPPAPAGKVHRQRNRIRSSRRAWVSAVHRRPDTPRRTGKHRSACVHAFSNRTSDRLSCCRAARLVRSCLLPVFHVRGAYSHHRPRRRLLVRALASGVWSSAFYCVGSATAAAGADQIPHRNEDHDDQSGVERSPRDVRGQKSVCQPKHAHQPERADQRQDWAD